MPPRDRIDVFLTTSGTPLTFGFNQCSTHAQSSDIARIDFVREGRDLRLSFYVDPKDTKLLCHDPAKFEKKPKTTTVTARLAWLFNSARIYLEAELNVNTGALLKLELTNFKGTVHKLLSVWESGHLEAVNEMLVPDVQNLSQGDLAKKIGDLSIKWGAADLHGPRVFLKPVNDIECGKSSQKLWIPVLESVVTLENGKNLDVWSVHDTKIRDSRIIRILQVPKSLTCGEVEQDPKDREWYLSLQGLPHSWGQYVWNILMSEQVRVSELDIQHGALFTPLFARIESPEHLSWNITYKVREDLKNKKINVFDHSLRLASKSKGGKVDLIFPLLRNHMGQPVKASMPLPFLELSDEKLASKKSFDDIVFQQALDALRHPGVGWAGQVDSTANVLHKPKTGIEPKDLMTRRVRIGALDVTFSPAALPVSQDLELLWRLESDSDKPLNPELKYRWQETRVNFEWAVDRITPGGQDDLTGELYVDCDEEAKKGLTDDERRERNNIECKLQRERPLVIPLSTQVDQKLILNVKERARQRDARRVDLTLRRSDQSPASELPTGDLTKICKEDAKGLDRVAVLDREPFLIAKVSFPALGSVKDQAASNEIATWRSYGHEAGSWRIPFPDAQNFCMTLPPQGVGETMEKAKTLGDKELADFRLSPPALLSMRETYYQQNFPEAPWNLRRLLSDPGRELPGAHLTQLQYELLYGLSCRIDYPFMRLAEISALVGDVMGPLPQKPRWVPRGSDGDPDTNMAEFYRGAQEKWAGVSQRTRQRLGIFELWDSGRFDTLELKESVTCWIRQMPGDQGFAGPVTEFVPEPANTSANPEPKRRPTTLPDELVPVHKADLANPFDDKSPGLKGGVTWGFESRNVYQAVLRESPGRKWSRSGGAEMRDTRFSALGGYGHQMSAFDNWRTKILADVSMGRTYSYTLERIGRIGVWWNRAKHVIIYERTVVPSRQFGALLAGHEDEQSKLEGRAVLRKVEEYVEILQNTRKYPDSERGNPKSAGFVTECSFSDDPNQIIRFRVRSSWGADVGTIGWKVPIWRPNEIPEDLYPKPVVNLTVLASVEGESVPRKVTIADPNNLFFYTDTTVTPEAQNDPSVDLSNTDVWPPVEGVDFVDEARPRPKPDKAFQSGSLQQSSSGDSVLPSGFRPCTFLIEPAEHTVDLLANRKGDPMGAALSSVTLCRAKLEERAQGISQQFRDSMEGVEDTVRNWLAKLPGEGRIPDSIDLNKGIEELCGKVKDSAEHWKKQTSTTQIDDLIKKATDQAFANIDKALNSMIGHAEKSDFGRALMASLETVRKGNGNLVDLLDKEISQNVEVLSQRVNGLLPSPAIVADSALGALQEVKVSLTNVKDQMDDFRRQIKSGLSMKSDFTDLEAKILLYVERLGGALEHAKRLAESGARIEIPVGDAKKFIPFVQGAKKVLETFRVSLDELGRQLSHARDAVAVLRAWHDRFDSITQQVVDQTSKLLKEATAWIDTANDEILKRLEEQILLLTDRENGIEAKILAKKNQWANDFKKALQEKSKEVIEALPAPASVLVFPPPWREVLQDQKQRLMTALSNAVDEIKGQHPTWFDPLKEVQLEDRCQKLQDRLSGLLASVGKDAKVVRQFLEERRDELLRELDDAFGDEVRTAKKILGEAEPVRQNVLNLVRAFGKPPEVSGLQFDRPEVAFFYNEIKDHVDVTPVIARAAQAGAVLEALKPFGVDLPVQELGEQLIPASLKNFDLSSILPNISGIPLQNLFSGVKMPDLSSEHVKVTHGVDVQTRRAWVNTDVNFVIPGDTKLFALGPLAVSINEPHFKAEARMEVGLNGTQKQRVNGRLGGDWKLRIGGFELITFTQTPLEFDDSGRVRFEVDPRKVQLAEALKFINDLLSKMSPGGLSIRFDGDGVVCSLDLPLPDTQLGAFGFSGLTLATSLALRYSGGDFSIGVTAGLARRDAPFTLTIFILGGGGYLELGSRYHPSTGKIAATADMAIAVSASLAIALGPISGGVAVYVGVTANYDSARGGGLVVGLMFMIRGHVSVLSIASATITLRLDGQYRNQELVGVGHLEIKIKICWCFTLEVSESVTYTLGSGKNAALGRPEPVAQLAMLDADPALLGISPEEEIKTRVEQYLDMLV